METDILGAPYQSRTIPLGDDDEGDVVATLVSRRSAEPTSRAVLYVHGFVDYFFQTHLADFFVTHGWDFYALDLRKYGRSLRPHQTPNFVRSLTEYFPELDEAARIIKNEDGHDTLLVNAHSTGGLIVPLWAHSRGDASPVDAMFLNSPFFDLNAPWLTRAAVAPAVIRLGGSRPYLKLPFNLGDVYGRSIHSEHYGEWTYDLQWKPLAGFPVLAGWLRAVRRGQLRLHAGLDLKVPVLVACSARSYKGTKWGEDALAADSVLDVEHITKWSTKLGRHLTLVRIDGGLHDVMLSAEPARGQIFAELERWTKAYL
ncbi:MAG TPA: alpha/beta hydrolase [Micromonosporaceae bacterium]